MPPGGRIGTTALSAADRPGKEVLCTAVFPKLPRSRLRNRGRCVDSVQARANTLPQLLLYNTKVGYFLPDPFCLRVISRYAATVCRVLDESLTVPYEAADIDLIMQNAAAAESVTADHRIAPSSGMWTRNTLRIEHLCDHAR